VDEGQRLVFNCHFGKLSLAVVDGERKAKAAAKPKISLAEYLAARTSNGHAI